MSNITTNNNARPVHIPYDSIKAFAPRAMYGADFFTFGVPIITSLTNGDGGTGMIVGASEFQFVRGTVELMCVPTEIGSFKLVNMPGDNETDGYLWDSTMGSEEGTPTRIVTIKDYTWIMVNNNSDLLEWTAGKRFDAYKKTGYKGEYSNVVCNIVLQTTKEKVNAPYEDGDAAVKA